MKLPAINLDELKNSNNITELLDSEALQAIGQQVIKGYDIDEKSRCEWKDTVDKAMDLAKQKVEPKNHPWPNASNIKFPLISQAAIQFAARVMPEVVQNYRVVKATVIGSDPEGLKQARASRVAQFMSYQLSCESTDWEEGTDKLLQILPILGTVFKKTYYDSISDKNVSMLCVPDKIVVNYDVPSLESARRITHIIQLSENDVIERQRRGIYSDEVDVELLRPEDMEEEDNDCILDLLEQHCYLDLDGDGYKEPYVVTVHKQSGAVLRIVNRFNTIDRNKKGQVTCITPIQYFTDFHFIRSPDGGFYSIGFGSLLLPINAAINTLINQLVDAGTLNNMQSGFLGRGLRIKNGEFKFKMGEWKVLDSASGTNIAQNVFALPTKEPSQTLFSLLGLLLQIGKDLSSSTDVLQGKEQAQNVSQGTMAALVEQGTKVFTAINKRLYRSLKKEYEKLYELNSHYLTNKKYKEVLDDEEADVKKDFELKTLDIVPVADPNLSSEQMRLQKASVMQQLPTVNRRAVDLYTLQTLGVEQSIISQLLPDPDPNAPPPPEVQLTLAKTQLAQAQIAEMSAKARLEAEQNIMMQQKLAMQAASTEAQVQEAAARAWKMQKDAQHGDAKVAIAAGKMQNQELLKGAEFAHKQEKETADLSLRALEISNQIKQLQLEAAKIEEQKKRSQGD